MLLLTNFCVATLIDSCLLFVELNSNPTLIQLLSVTSVNFFLICRLVKIWRILMTLSYLSFFSLQNFFILGMEKLHDFLLGVREVCLSLWEHIICF